MFNGAVNSSSETSQMNALPECATSGFPYGWSWTKDAQLVVGIHPYGRMPCRLQELGMV